MDIWLYNRVRYMGFRVKGLRLSGGEFQRGHPSTRLVRCFPCMGRLGEMKRLRT